MSKRRARRKPVPKDYVPPFATSIWLPMDLKEDLEEEAKNQERSRSWVMLSILRQWQTFYRQQKKMSLPK